MSEIVARFKRLALKIARVFAAGEFLRNDLANEARIALVAAVRHHDSNRPSFPGFAEIYMRGAAIRELGRWNRPGEGEDAQAISLDATDLLKDLPSGDSPEDEDEDEAVARLAPWGSGPAAEVIEDLDDSRLQLVKERYVEDARSL